LYHLLERYIEDKIWCNINTRKFREEIIRWKQRIRSCLHTSQRSGKKKTQDRNSKLNEHSLYMIEPLYYCFSAYSLHDADDLSILSSFSSSSCIHFISFCQMPETYKHRRSFSCTSRNFWIFLVTSKTNRYIDKWMHASILMDVSLTAFSPFPDLNTTIWQVN
jgi:hypothetical protein